MTSCSEKSCRIPGYARDCFQRILPDLKIDYIEYPELQKTIKPEADAKSIRLDVYIKDDKNVVYNIEMQASDTKELPKRSRYYQSLIDLQLIDKGQTYRKLNRSFIIFICLEDIFGHGRHIYTFENLCKEDSSISMGDETTKIFLNADSKMDDVSKELKAFLDYVGGKITEDTFVQELDEAVVEAKQNREWRHEYMTLLMRDQVNVEKGIEQGIEQGENKLSKLIATLMENGRSQDVIRVTQDKEYRNKLYQEYLINQ